MRSEAGSRAISCGGMLGRYSDRLAAITSSQAHTPTILNHSRALPQRDGDARPAFVGGVISGESKLIVLDAGNVLHDAFAIGSPGVDAETQVRPCGHPRPLLPQSSSASRSDRKPRRIQIGAPVGGMSPVPALAIIRLNRPC